MADDVTRRLLADAGVREGMRVLDIGSGRGDVALLAADLVGACGWVLGIDRDAVAIEAADARVREMRLPNVGFARGELGALTGALGRFDACDVPAGPGGVPVASRRLMSASASGSGRLLRVKVPPRIGASALMAPISSQSS